MSTLAEWFVKLGTTGASVVYKDITGIKSSLVSANVASTGLFSSLTSGAVKAVAAITGVASVLAFLRKTISLFAEAELAGVRFAKSIELAVKASQAANASQQASDWVPNASDLRPDGTRKGSGFLGPQQGRGQMAGETMTEFSIGININGQELDVPTLIPGLTHAELDATLSGNVLKSVIEKAAAHARNRIASGKPVFADAGESLKQRTAAGFSANELQILAKASANRFGTDDDDEKRAMTNLLQYRQIQGKTFAEALALAHDYAALMGGDVADAAHTVGRALENPVEGSRMLKSLNIELTDKQEDYIKALVESGQLAQAQSYILAEMKSRVDGMAQAVRGTLTGAWAEFKVQVGDLMEFIGEPWGRALAIGLQTLSGWLAGFNRVMRFIQSNLPTAIDLFNAQLVATGYLILDTLEPPLQYIGDLWNWVEKVAVTAMTQAVEGIWQLFKNLGANVKELFTQAWSVLMNPGTSFDWSKFRGVMEGMPGDKEMPAFPEFKMFRSDQRAEAEAEVSRLAQDLGKRWADDAIKEQQVLAGAGKRSPGGPLKAPGVAEAAAKRPDISSHSFASLQGAMIAAAMKDETQKKAAIETATATKKTAEAIQQVAIQLSTGIRVEGLAWQG